jgi:hypothetical protein
MPRFEVIPSVKDFQNPAAGRVYIPQHGMEAVRLDGKWFYIFGEGSRDPLTTPVNVLLTDGAIGDGEVGNSADIYRKAMMHMDDGK